jgi:hypothetical protein
MGRIRKKYDQWRIEERVSLILQAIARNDRSESNWLYASTPRRTLRGPDPRFLKAMQAVFAINCWIAIELSRRLGTLNGIGIARIAADAVIRDTVHHGIAAQFDLVQTLGTSSKKRLHKTKPAPLVDENALEMDDLISPTLTNIVIEIVSLRSALDSFAREELNISADQLLDATHPELNVQLQAPIFSQLPGNDDVQAAVSEKLNDIWAAFLG